MAYLDYLGLGADLFERRPTAQTRTNKSDSRIIFLGDPDTDLLRGLGEGGERFSRETFVKLDIHPTNIIAIHIGKAIVDENVK